MILAALLAAAFQPAPGSADAAPAAPVRRVYVGVYLADVSGFDLKEGRFKADIHLWCKWLGPAEPPPVAIANAEIEKQEEIARESEGDWRSVRWRVQGTFRGTFPLHRFPFDIQQLEIRAELPAEHGDLVPDLAGSGMAPQFSITGWLYEPHFKAHRGAGGHASDFGSVVREGVPLDIRSVGFALTLRRPFAAYIIKFMLPLAIIIAMGVLAFFLPGDQIEVRGGIGVTALLSCVAFHFSQADSLPDVSYLVTADKLFLGSYVLILAALVESVVSYHLFRKDPRVSKIVDRSCYAGIPALALIGAIALLGGASAVEEEPPSPRTASLPTPASARPQLRASITSLPSLNIAGLSGLLRRGLTHTDAGQRVPHLVERVPDMTNELVHLLPDGGMIVRWRLRPGLRWSDGSAIDARDLAFSAGLLANERRREIRFVDPRTIDIVYSNRAPGHLTDFTVYPERDLAEVFKAEGIEGVQRRVRTSPPPGDGPFVLESMDVGKSAMFRRNPHFAGAPSALERIEVRVVEKGAGDALLRGEIDLLPVTNIDTAGLLSGKPGIRVRTGTSGMYYFIQPDITVKPFDDLRVRQALLHAIDRARVASALEGERGRVAHSYLPETAADFADGVVRYDHDPEKSKRLLAAAGLTAPVPVRLLALGAVSEISPRGRAIALLKHGLDSAGFATTFEAVKGSTLDLFLKGTHGGLLFFSRDDTSVAARFWNLTYANGRYETETPARLFDAPVVALHRRMTTTLFDERRQVLARQLQVEWSKRLPILPVAFGAEISAHADALEGWDPDAASNIWWNVERWRFRN